jgi:hypothetical protein
VLQASTTRDDGDEAAPQHPADGELASDTSIDDMLVPQGSIGVHMRQISICVVVGSVLMLAGCSVDATSDDESMMDEEGEIAEAEQAAAAPPLTYLEIKGVYSSKYPNGGYGEQPIADSAFITTQDHGGAELYVLTQEMGYGQYRVAKMNGTQLVQDSEQAILGAGNIVTGYYRWWKASGYESGSFSYQSSSINYPWTTRSDSLTIK